MMNLDSNGKKSQREADTVVMALSLIGGFVTAMYYGTFYSYLYITYPTTELKLAYSFEKTVQHHSEINNLNEFLTEEEVQEVEVLRSLRFRCEYFCFRRVCCFKWCKKKIIGSKGSKLGTHIEFVKSILDNLHYCLSIEYFADNYKVQSDKILKHKR